MKTNFEKNAKCNKKRKKRFYSDLEFIEELDIDTGEVRAIHTLNTKTSNNGTCKKNQLNTEDLFFKLTNDRVYGIVMLPTRELALQVLYYYI